MRSHSRQLTWLHLSDIHFCPHYEWRDTDNRDALIRYLENLFASDETLRPDLIFCTGDIAFGETSTSKLDQQYSLAKEFFNTLLGICGANGESFPKERLFVVPGNHDVNRSKINSDAQATLLSWALEPPKHVDKINQRFNDQGMEFTDTIKRLDNFGLFVSDYLPHQFDAEGRHRFATTIHVKGLSVGIAGFNSAWTCAGPEDDRNLWVAAKWQFNAANQQLSKSDLRIGLIHHPLDWFNSSERDVSMQRIAANFDFWLHGHTHNAWVTPVQSHIVIAAGAVGAGSSDEFGVNITTVDFAAGRGTVHLHCKRGEQQGWTISPVDGQAPAGKWLFELPSRLRDIGPIAVESPSQANSLEPNDDFLARYLDKRLEEALVTFSSQPRVWVTPTLFSIPETSTDTKDVSPVDLAELISNPASTVIMAPPQYGLTCLAHFFVKEAWGSMKAVWLYLDAKRLKAFNASIDKAASDELALMGRSITEVRCVIVDGWSPNEKDAIKLLKGLCAHFKDLPIICMQQLDGSPHPTIQTDSVGRDFRAFFLWALSRGAIRSIVTAYNSERHIGDDDVITNRIVADLQVLNLHRTPLNCLTLLKVSEINFDESPVNRCEMIKRMLFLLFNVDEIPTYKSRPDLKDCEFVLGYFCEILIREGAYFFTRDRFLLETQKCCREGLIDLETQVVFDVLYANRILLRYGSQFCFRFTYWIFYFAAQRMHHNSEFATFIFEQMRYAQYPELIEFYTGIDRQRKDALDVLIRDLERCRIQVHEKCGLPSDLNPYRLAKWESLPETREQMHKEIAEGVRGSQLPEAIKDKYADKTYDRSKPYEQSVANVLSEHSFANMMLAVRAGARALRNSDYVAPEIKRALLGELLRCWDQASRVLLVILPTLAKEGYAIFDGAGFSLAEEFSAKPEERFFEILIEVPQNVAMWSEDDLFSPKLGPLLFDQLLRLDDSSAISRHELIILLIRRRPRDWDKHVRRYIAAVSKNSFYLMDVYRNLRAQYRFGFASTQTLRDIEQLIKVAAAKHITGDKNPSEKTISKVLFGPDVIPKREV